MRTAQEILYGQTPERGYSAIRLIKECRLSPKHILVMRALTEWQFDERDLRSHSTRELFYRANQYRPGCLTFVEHAANQAYTLRKRGLLLSTVRVDQIYRRGEVMEYWSLTFYGARIGALLSAIREPDHNSVSANQNSHASA